MSLSNSEDSVAFNKPEVKLGQIIPLILAAVLFTIGLAMFLGGTSNLIDIARPATVVFGGTVVGLLVTFPASRILQSWQIALERAVYGGTEPVEMVRALIRVCDISRRDGLLGVSEIRSNSVELEEVCHLIGDAAETPTIQFALERRLAAEYLHHRMVADVFVFSALYALLIGLLGSVLLVFATENMSPQLSALPFVCGASFALIMTILTARLRSSHFRELVVLEIAYRGASIILEDNNAQRLYARLLRFLPRASS
ncbi:MAG: hypothetical protein AB8B63_13525 [Granulosicoccus sp.]